MQYHKPEVVKVANAVYAIQGVEKSYINFPESETFIYNTTNAYEADE